MRLLPIFLLMFSYLAYGQELHNPNKLPLCPIDQSQKFDNCWGTYTYANGDKYVGEFKNWKKHGLGTYYQLADAGHKGEKYIGEFENDDFHGLGTYLWPEGHSHRGHFKKMKPDGKGVKKLKDGTMYQGVFSDWSEGIVVFTKLNGTKYVGEIKAGVPQGRGKLSFKNGSWFDGIFQGKSLIEGELLYYNSEKSTYLEGIWKDNKLFRSEKVGLTALVDERSLVYNPLEDEKRALDAYKPYTENFTENIAEDENFIREAKEDPPTQDNSVSTSEHIEREVNSPSDLPMCRLDQNNLSYHNCWGTYPFANGDKYVGEFKDGAFHGQGTLTKAGGNSKEGIWENGRFVRETKVEPPHESMNVATSLPMLQDVNNTNKLPMCPSGQHTRLYCWGSITLESGDKYEGEFKNGVREGKGTFYFLGESKWKGDKYVGEFKNNKMHGRGAYTWVEGHKYVGEFKDNTLHGLGVFTAADDKRMEGIWENGKFIREARVNLPVLNNGLSKNVAADTDIFNLTYFEAECQRIGFAPKTEKFGECVMDLYKRRVPTDNQKSSQSPSTQSASKDKFVLECTKMGFREGTPDSSNCALSLRRHDAEMNIYQQQQQIYERQVDQAEKANRLAATQRLLEIANQGFGMASGNSFTPSLRNISPLPAPPGPLQFVSPRGNRYTCSYSGVQLVCR